MCMLYMQGLITNLAESSSQAHNTQGQGTRAHLLEPIEEETTSSPSIDSLGETLDALSITETTDVRISIILCFHCHEGSIKIVTWLYGTDCYVGLSNFFTHFRNSSTG